MQRKKITKHKILEGWRIWLIKGLRHEKGEEKKKSRVGEPYFTLLEKAGRNIFGKLLVAKYKKTQTSMDVMRLYDHGCLLESEK